MSRPEPYLLQRQDLRKIAPQFTHAGFETLVLPSSSPANAQWSFDEKLAEWKKALA